MNKRVLIPSIWVLFFFLQPQVQARVYLITNTSDTTNVTSLRGAIIDANKHGGNNTIMLSQSILLHVRIATPVVLHLTRAGADEDAALSGDLDITKGQLSIIGPAAAGLTIDATGLGDRLFQVFPHASLILQNVNLTGGTAPGGQYGFIESSESGGAIWNAGNLSLINCVILGNSSGGGNEPQGNGGGTDAGDGGGIYNSGQLVMQNCWLVENSAGSGTDGSAGGNGGGLGNDGICVLSNCVVEGNQSGAGGGPDGNAWGGGGAGGNGGGIYNSDTMTLLNSSISNNFAGAGASGGQPTGTFLGYIPGGWAGSGGSGAGIYNDGTLNVLKSSLVNNSAGNGGDGGPGGGSPGQAGFGGDGAGIFNAKILNLTNCIVSGNTCGNGGTGGACSFGNGADGGLGGSGGGIYTAGTFRANTTTISWNFTGIGGTGGDCLNNYSATNFPGNGTVGGVGGGVFNQGVACLNASTICSNICADGGSSGTDTVSGVVTGNAGDGGSGGGICSLDSLTLTNCTISGNLCGNSGSGQLNDGSAGGSGGGIFNDGILRQTSCTVTANAFGTGSTNISPGGGHVTILYGSGGGLFNETNAESAIVRNSIIAGNQLLMMGTTPGAGLTVYNSDVDVSGSFTSQGFNLVGIAGDDSGFVNGTNADQVGSDMSLVDPLLGSLQMNGGSTPTHALLPGSPAIDQGKSFGIHVDQRGKLRPHNFPAIPNASGGDGSDIGAFEL